MLASLFVTSACTDVEPRASSDTEHTQAGEETQGTDDASTGDDAGQTQPIDLPEGWLDAVEGRWLGSVTETPIGGIPQFFIDYERMDDGSLHALIDNGEGFAFEFHFRQDDDDRWELFEEGQLPGGFIQSYVLHPVEAEDGRVRFVTLEAPEFLQVDIDVSATTYDMQVRLMEEPHAQFELTRQ